MTYDVANCCRPYRGIGNTDLRKYLLHNELQSLTGNLLKKENRLSNFFLLLLFNQLKFIQVQILNLLSWHVKQTLMKFNKLNLFLSWFFSSVWTGIGATQHQALDAYWARMPKGAAVTHIKLWLCVTQCGWFGKTEGRDFTEWQIMMVCRQPLALRGFLHHPQG